MISSLCHGYQNLVDCSGAASFPNRLLPTWDVSVSPFPLHLLFALEKRRWQRQSPDFAPPG